MLPPNGTYTRTDFGGVGNVVGFDEEKTKQCTKTTFCDPFDL
jgi:hypothetical protein